MPSPDAYACLRRDDTLRQHNAITRHAVAQRGGQTVAPAYTVPGMMPPARCC